MFGILEKLETIPVASPAIASLVVAAIGLAGISIYLARILRRGRPDSPPISSDSGRSNPVEILAARDSESRGVMRYLDRVVLGAFLVFLLAAKAIDVGDTTWWAITIACLVFILARLIWAVRLQSRA
jgi:hypothetical protein